MTALVATPRPAWSAAPGLAVPEVSPAPAAIAGPQTRAERRRARRGAPASGLTVALAAFFCLSLGEIALAWWDALIRPPGLKEGIVGYGICLGIVLLAVVAPGRWKAVPVAAAALAGTALPVVLARGLLRTIPAPDVWIGQSLTLAVLFPLVVGTAATVAWLRRPRRRREAAH